MKIQNWIRKRWAVIAVAFFFLTTWAVVTKIRQASENSAQSADARLQAILQAKAVLIGRMDEAERTKDKQAYMQFLKAYLEKQIEYDKILPGEAVFAKDTSPAQTTGFSEAEKLDMLASEYGLSAEVVKNLKSQIEIMFRETPAPDEEALGEFLKSK
jgi:hypothetical protein